MEYKRNTDSVVQEIMGWVDYYNGATKWGTTEQQIAARDAIESKLRESVERCSVRKPLSVQEIERESLHGQFRDGVRFAERKHNIINTTKE